MRRLSLRAAGSRVAWRAGPAVPAGLGWENRLRRRLRAAALQAAPGREEPMTYQRERCAETESMELEICRLSLLVVYGTFSY